tara:strand:- start:597 stop:842 length:246 start_codon:yes stop_codon:yes gene_type:complete
MSHKGLKFGESIGGSRSESYNIHINHEFTDAMKDAVRKVEGVDTVSFTRYCADINICKLFNVANVKADVEKAIAGIIKSER